MASEPSQRLRQQRRIVNSLMHIAFNGWFWDQPFTGSGQYLRQIVPALLQIDSTLKLTLVLPDRMRNAADIPPHVAVHYVTVQPTGNLGKVLFEQRGFPTAIAAIKPDIAHVPYWGGPLDSPVPQIVTVHDVIPLSMAEYRSGFMARLYFSLVTASAKGATHIITDSEFSKQEIIQKIGVPADRVTAIPLAMSPDFHPRVGAEHDEAVREKYKLPEQYVLYLGGFDVRKNLRSLIAAYTYVGPSVGDDYPLVLAGKEPAQWGSPRFPDIHAEIAARPELAAWIRWIGAPDEADKPAVYRMASAFVFPSRYEGFGLGPLEAMSCGTVVVAADASSVPEVVGDAAYLVDPDDSRAMGGAIIAVLIQNDLRESLRNLGLARSTAFSWQRTARETLQVYQQVNQSRR
ncbi:MAG: glycosyltransferase family 4 protein [Anaerolineae bacterium]|nr:glycosyltransferase family 4 protein [Anaerolineae bacterium]